MTDSEQLMPLSSHAAAARNINSARLSPNVSEFTLHCMHVDARLIVAGLLPCMLLVAIARGVPRVRFDVVLKDDLTPY